ncbi:MAG: hypothetical protein QM695_01285 [Micropruina sp.]
MSGPVTTVLDALHQGVGSVTEVSRRTGLRVDVVRAAADQLVRMGRAQQCQLAVGCPPAGCGDCVLTCARRG